MKISFKRFGADPRRYWWQVTQGSEKVGTVSKWEGAFTANGADGRALGVLFDTRMEAALALLETAEVMK